MKIYFNLENSFVQVYNFSPTFEYTNEKEITEEEYNLLNNHFPFVKYVDNKFVLDEVKKNKSYEQGKLYAEQQEILKWLIDHDWIVNKVVLGEWTKEDPRWLKYLEERKIKRNRLDEIEKK